MRAVIRGEWESLDAAQAPNDTLAPQKRTNDAYSNRAGWVSKYLSRHPQSGESRESQRAHYHAKIRPTDLLERSRQWINRRDYEFQKFNSVDLRRYLTLPRTSTRSSTLSASAASSRLSSWPELCPPVGCC